MRTTTRKNRLMLALVAIALVGGTGCGDDGVGPGDDPDDPAVDLTGVWEFDASRFEGEYLDGGEGMTITAILDLQQEGRAISGAHRGGTVRRASCSWSGRSTDCSKNTQNVPGGPVQGSVHGNTVVLEFNADDSGEIDRFEGMVSGDTIQGDGWSAVRGTSDQGEAGSALAAPTSLQAAVVETGSAPEVDLSWRDNSHDEDGFAVGESCDGADWAGIGQTGPDATGTRVGGPFPGTECSYMVVAFRLAADSTIFSDVSNIATVTLPTSLTVTSVSPAGGPVGTEVTIRGEGFTASGGSPDVLVAGRSASEFILSIADDAITLLMPNAGGAGSHEVSVSVGSITSNSVTWTQQGDLDADEPNDEPATATPVTIQFMGVRSFHTGDRQDLYRFSLSSTATLELLLLWNTGHDLDVIVQPATTATPFDASAAAFDNDVCGGSGATSDAFEQAVCPDLAPGDYVLHVIDFDHFHSGDEAVKSYGLVANIR